MDELVLVGGCAVGLLMTDRARPPVRQTIDVDVLTEVTPLGNYYALCDRLRERGFAESPEVICRWQFQGLKIDVMPIRESVPGFTNSWYAEAARTAFLQTLPSGRVIRLISPRVFVATKLESFAARGQGDYLHHDLEDIVTFVYGRPGLVGDIAHTRDEIQAYISEELEALMTQPEFGERLVWLLSGQLDRRTIVLERIRKICGL